MPGTAGKRWQKFRHLKLNMADEEEQLLVASDHDAEWDAIDSASRSVTVRELIARDPDNVITFLKTKGVSKLGEFKVEASESERATTAIVSCLSLSPRSGLPCV